MNNIIKLSYALLALVFIVVSCKTEMVEPIDIFTLEQGGYMRIISGTTCVSSANVKRTDMAGTSLSLVHEAITPNKGANFDTYTLEMRHVGATSTEWKTFRTINATDYKADATTGYPRHTFTVTGAEALTFTGLDTSKVADKSRFELRGTMKLKDGKTYNDANTGSNITGGAFYCSPFTYRLNVVQ